MTLAEQEAIIAATANYSLTRSIMKTMIEELKVAVINKDKRIAELEAQVGVAKDFIQCRNGWEDNDEL